MVSYIMTFFAGFLCGSLAMGLFVAFVKIRDAMDDW